MAYKRKWVSGGDLGLEGSRLGAGPADPNALLDILVDKLKAGETVTRALKRLRPAQSQAGRRPQGRKAREEAKNKKAADDLLQSLEGGSQQVDTNKMDFDKLTEAATELMQFGFEDVYTETREQLIAALDSGQIRALNRGSYIWHDDGSSQPRHAQQHRTAQRDAKDDLLRYQDLQADAPADLPKPFEQCSHTAPNTRQPEQRRQEPVTSTAPAPIAAQPPSSQPRLAPLPPPPVLKPPATSAAPRQPAQTAGPIYGACQASQAAPTAPPQQYANEGWQHHYQQQTLQQPYYQAPPYQAPPYQHPPYQHPGYSAPPPYQSPAAWGAGQHPGHHPPPAYQPNPMPDCQPHFPLANP